MTDFRSLTFRTDVSSEIRTMEFNGISHVVVPVVPLRAGVMQAVNAPNPELVLYEEIARVPQGWNGRPVLPDHPMSNGSKISANNPRTLESESFGYLFNTEARDDRLITEAWLDPLRAEKVGALAMDVIARARARQPIEVSVGVFLTLEESEGTDNGKKYSGIWRDIVPDHLAMLPRDATGACSNKDGCGAPRVAQGVEPMAKCKHGVSTTETCAECADEIKPRTLRERLSALMTFRSNAGVAADMSDQDLRNLLETELRAIEPGFLGVDAVFPGNSEVVYAVMPKDQLSILKRTYSITSKGLKLGDKAVGVQPVTTYEELTAAKAAPCGCGGTSSPTVASEGVETMAHKNAERIKALIEAKHFGDADQPMLEALSEATFEKVYGSLTAKAPEASASKVEEKTVEVVAAAAALKPQTEEEWLNQPGTPQSIRDMVARQKAADTALRADLVTKLEEKAQGVYTKAELEALPLDTLQRVARIAKAAPSIDYSGNGVTRVGGENKQDFTPPNPYKKDLEARQAQAH